MSDKRRSASRWAITIILIGSLTFALDQSVSWTPPIAYTNGNPLLEQDLDFYTIYCGGVEFVEIDSVIGTRTALIDFSPLGEGTHVCEMTVTALNGRESAPSNSANFTVGPRTPQAPQNFVITLSP
jgi:hypothetical protein